MSQFLFHIQNISKVKMEVIQSCVIVCDPMDRDYSPWDHKESDMTEVT